MSDRSTQRWLRDVPAPDTGAHGPVMAIGGAEDKVGRRTVLKRFVALSGGADARIVVIPTASSLGAEVVDVYAALFRRLGAQEVVAARPESRADAESPAFVDLLDDATGVFMTGGNQLKLSGVVSGTAFGEAILRAHRRGAVIAGTSAGASIQSSHMVAFGAGGTTPKQRMTQLAAGLGLVQDVVIDQHFAQRNRYGRLLMLVAQSPSLLGIGVDEDTAAVMSEDRDGRLLRVVGRGAVTVFDARAVTTDAHQARRTAPMLASGVVLHVLPQGSVFDLAARSLLPASPAVDQAEVDELAVAGRDLQRLARDIAADDVSPSVLRRRRARTVTGESDEGVT